MVGWMPGKQIEGKIKLGHVLIAEEATQRRSDEATEGNTEASSSSPFVAPSLRRSTPSPLGYCISHDQYMGRDDVGIIYQLNVLPLRQRNLIGATLIKSVFERAAYGCKLFCLWCAQDIRANYFWEAIGFVPLAFRTGSASKQRIHIFWQRRIRENDQTTPWWFPSQTRSGAIREDRLVLPIPQGTHWRDVMPIVLPGMTVEPQPEAPKELPGGAPLSPRPEQPKLTKVQKAAIHRSQSKHLAGVPLGKKAVLTASGIKYVDRADYIPEIDAPEGFEPPAKPRRARTARRKHDPKLIAAARELRDRWLEQVNATPLPSHGKYDITRALSASTTPIAALPAA
jgi:hypothetical protein